MKAKLPLIIFELKLQSCSELLTIYLFGHMQGLTTQRHIYDYIRNHWREWFPALPAYKSVNCRLNALAPAFELLIQELLTTQAWQVAATNDRLIDSLPVMLACGARANRARVAPELADTGFCATKQQHYRGVKLHFTPPVASRDCRCRRRFTYLKLRNMTCRRCAKCHRVCLRAALCSPTKPIS